MRYVLLILAFLYVLLFINECTMTQAHAGFWHKDKAEVVQVDKNHLVEAVPQGPLHKAKPDSFAKQIARGGVFSVGVGIVAGIIKIGIFAVTGIPLI